MTSVFITWRAAVGRRPSPRPRAIESTARVYDPRGHGPPPKTGSGIDSDPELNLDDSGASEDPVPWVARWRLGSLLAVPIGIGVITWALPVDWVAVATSPITMTATPVLITVGLLAAYVQWPELGDGVVTDDSSTVQPPSRRYESIFHPGDQITRFDTGRVARVVSRYNDDTGIILVKWADTWVLQDVDEQLFNLLEEPSAP